jgi:hypothetical protein
VVIYQTSKLLYDLKGYELRSWFSGQKEQGMRSVLCRVLVEAA